MSYKERFFAIFITYYLRSVEKTTLHIEPRPTSSRITMAIFDLPRNFYNTALKYFFLYLAWNSLMELLSRLPNSSPACPAPPAAPGITFLDQPDIPPPCPPCLWNATPSLTCHPSWRQKHDVIILYGYQWETVHMLYNCIIYSTKSFLLFFLVFYFISYGANIQYNYMFYF